MSRSPTPSRRSVVGEHAESQIALLQQVADAATTKTPIRLLVLARSPEGWWQGTQTDAGMSSVFDPSPLRLIARSDRGDQGVGGRDRSAQDRETGTAQCVADYRQSRNSLITCG